MGVFLRKTSVWATRAIVAAIASLALVFGVSSVSTAATTTVNAAGGNLLFNNAVKIGQNAPVGFSTRYPTVFAGVDALVTVTEINNSTLNNVDRVSTVNNWQLWTNVQVGSGGGSTNYRVDFVKAGTREPVIMQNFFVNVGDIDAKQFVEFTSPTSYTLAQNTQLSVIQNAQNSAVPAGAFRFAEPNGTGSTDDDTRYWAQVKYAAVSSVDVKLGAAVGGSALFQVSFSSASWSGTTTQDVTPTPPQYTVSYNCNPGGLTCDPNTSTVSTTLNGGSTHAIQANGYSMTASGYTFNSWNTQPDGSGVKYLAGDGIIPTTDVTLYAVWENTNTSVTYHPNALDTTGSVPGTAGVDTVTKGSQYEIQGQNTLARTGFEFIGWNTVADGSGDNVFYLAGTLMNIVANTDLYAVWKPLPEVPADSPINIDVEPGQPIGGGEVDYVIDDEPSSAVVCDANTDPKDFWSISVTSVDPVVTTTEIDAGCPPADGDIYGSAVLPQDIPEGVYEIVFESDSGEQIIRYFAVGPNGTFEGQSNTKIVRELANTGAQANPFAQIVVPVLIALLVFGGLTIALIGRKRKQASVKQPDNE